MSKSAPSTASTKVSAPSASARTNASTAAPANRVCPVEAIFYEDDIPGEWQGYRQANVEFFDELGSPGGVSKLGVIERDHPLVAALPLQTRA